jgi:hypothetical protein
MALRDIDPLPASNCRLSICICDAPIDHQPRLFPHLLRIAHICPRIAFGKP